MANKYKPVIKSPKDNLDIKKYGVAATTNVVSTSGINEKPDVKAFIGKSINVDKSSDKYSTKEPLANKKRNNQSITYSRGSGSFSRNLKESSDNILQQNTGNLQKNNFSSSTNPDYLDCNCEPCEGVCCRPPKNTLVLYLQGNFYNQTPLPSSYISGDINSEIYENVLNNSISFSKYLNIESWLSSNGWIFTTDITDDGSLLYYSTCYGEISTSEQYSPPPDIPEYIGSFIGEYPYVCYNGVGDKVCDNTVESKYDCEDIGGIWHSFVTCDDEPCVSPSPSVEPSPEPSAEPSPEPSPS